MVGYDRAAAPDTRLAGFLFQVYQALSNVLPHLPPKIKTGLADLANPFDFSGRPSGARTLNLVIKSHLLYQLS